MSDVKDARYTCHTGDHQKPVTTVAISSGVWQGHGPITRDKGGHGELGHAPEPRCMHAWGIPSQTFGLGLLFGRTEVIISASQGSCEAY